MQFNFTVENKILIPNDGEYTVIADNSDYSVCFSFDEEWTGKTKTVRFINGKNYVDVILPKNNTVSIPLEVMSPPSISVGVYAGQLHTSSAAVIKCRTSILTPNGTPKEPVEDVYGQLISQYDEVKNALFEVNGEVDSLISSEEQRQNEEKKRQSSELERQALYGKLKETEESFSNAYIQNIVRTEDVSTFECKHCITDDEPFEFYILGSFSETVPSGGKSPLTPSKINFSSLSRVAFGDQTVTYRNTHPVVSMPQGISDRFDLKNGQFVHNVGTAEFHHLDGEIYLFDTVRRVYGKRYSLRRVESTSGSNVFTDDFEAYPFAKAGMKTFSPHFNTSNTVDGCDHGFMYDGNEHYFGFGAKNETDAEAYLAFHQFVKELYESGSPLTVYYEYGEPFIEEIEKPDLHFKSSVTTVNTRRNPFVIRYKADINSLVNGLQEQINELASALVAMAEGGDNNA